jgi:hypothetical protein
MAFLEIAAAALGRGIASEWMRIRRERSLVKLPSNGGGNGQPSSQRRDGAGALGNPVKLIGHERR